MTTLEDLWYGNISPNKQDSYWADEYKDLLELFTRNSDKLSATLNAEEKETLEKIHDCWQEMQQYAECGAFITGFRLAVQLMAESLTGPPASRG